MRVLVYLTRQALELKARPEALLSAKGHPVRTGRLVRRAAKADLDVPRLNIGDLDVRKLDTGDLDLCLVDPTDPPRNLSDDNETWLLSRNGHARRVRPQDGQNWPPATDGKITVVVGDEHMADAADAPSQQRVLGSPLPDPDGVDRAAAVLSEIGAQVRALTDVRFKLLALVPVVSGAALLAVVTTKGPLEGLPAPVRLLAALLGFVNVTCVRIYDVRNSQLYDDLISRGRTLERELGVTYGVFQRRRGSLWPVEHNLALQTLYLTVIAAWAIAALIVILGTWPADAYDLWFEPGTAPPAAPTPGAPAETAPPPSHSPSPTPTQ